MGRCFPSRTNPSTSLCSGEKGVRHRLRLRVGANETLIGTSKERTRPAGDSPLHAAVGQLMIPVGGRLAWLGSTVADYTLLMRAVARFHSTVGRWLPALAERYLTQRLLESMVQRIDLLPLPNTMFDGGTPSRAAQSKYRRP